MQKVKLNYSGGFCPCYAYLLLLFLSISAQSRGQMQSNIAQFANYQLPFNPAYSLLSQTGSLNTLVKKQLTGINGAPVSLMVNGYLPISAIGAAAGVFVLHDQVAVERLTELKAFFAKSIRLNDSQHLGVAINAGYRFYKADYLAADPSGNDPNFSNNVSQNEPNVGLALIYYSDRFYLGAHLPRLSIRKLGNASLIEESNNNKTYYLTGAYLFTLAESVKIKPAALVNYTDNMPIELGFSTMIYTNEQFGGGFSYSTREQLAGIFAININSLKIGYSYQFSVGQITSFGNGTHEFTLGLRFGQAPKKYSLL